VRHNHGQRLLIALTDGGAIGRFVWNTAGILDPRSASVIYIDPVRTAQ
jgi:hypothetical protein